MKRFVQFAVVSLAVTCASLAFAVRDSTLMHIQFINKTVDTGNANLYSVNTETDGPIVERNGGTSTLSAPVPNELQLLSLEFMTGWGYFCLQNEHNLILNPLKYAGDTVVVTFSGITPQGMQCTCTGSACDVGTSTKKFV